MTIAILGGTGFLGTATARALCANGHEVVAIARGNIAPNLPIGAQFVTADRMDTDTLDAVLRTHKIQTLVDIYPLSLRNTKSVLKAVAATGVQYVMVSSTDVYANYEGLLRRGNPPIRTTPATEDSPLRIMRHPYRGNPNRPKGAAGDLLEDYDKIPVEEAIRADGRFPFAILRPPMIYGPGDGQRRFGWAIDAVQKGGTIPLDEQAAGWLNSYAYVDDVADAIARLATDQRAVGETYNIAQPRDYSVRQWLEEIMGIMGKSRDILIVPADENGLMSARAEAMDLRYPLTLDGQKIRRDLGFVETCDLEQSLMVTLAADPAHHTR